LSRNPLAPAASLKPEQLRGGGEYNFAKLGDRAALLEVDSDPHAGPVRQVT
jgi:hypothetical protein